MPQTARPQLTPTLPDFPSVKPSAIALGTVYTHAISLAVLAPVFGDTYHRAQAANSKEEFAKSKEAAGAAAAWGSSLAGSAIQTYGVSALLVATGTLTNKGAASVGTLIFLATSAPSVSPSCLSSNLLYSNEQNAGSSRTLVIYFLISRVQNLTTDLVHLPGLHRETSYRHCRHRRCCPPVRDSRPQPGAQPVGRARQPF